MSELSDRLSDLERKRTQGKWKPGRSDMISETMDGKLFKNIYAKDKRGGETQGQPLPLIIGRAEREFDTVPLEEVFANATLLSCSDLIPRLGMALEDVTDHFALALMVSGTTPEYAAIACEPFRALLVELAEKVKS